MKQKEMDIKGLIVSIGDNKNPKLTVGAESYISGKVNNYYRRIIYIDTLLESIKECQDSIAYNDLMTQKNFLYEFVNLLEDITTILGLEK